MGKEEGTWRRRKRNKERGSKILNWGRRKRLEGRGIERELNIIHFFTWGSCKILSFGSLRKVSEDFLIWFLNSQNFYQVLLLRNYFSTSGIVVVNGWHSFRQKVRFSNGTVNSILFVFLLIKFVCSYYPLIIIVSQRALVSLSDRHYQTDSISILSQVLEWRKTSRTKKQLVGINYRKQLATQKHL